MSGWTILLWPEWALLALARYWRRRPSPLFDPRLTVTPDRTFPETDNAIERALRVLGVVAFIVLLGWTLPGLGVVPVLRIMDLVTMLREGRALFLGADVSLLVPFTVGLYAAWTSTTLRRFLGRWPWLWPLLILLWFYTVGFTLTTHAVYELLLASPGARLLPGAVAVVGVLLTRGVTGAFFLWRPMEGFVVDGFGVPLRERRLE